jgi:hypothetical protein
VSVSPFSATKRHAEIIDRDLSRAHGAFIASRFLEYKQGKGCERDGHDDLGAQAQRTPPGGDEKN